MAASPPVPLTDHAALARNRHRALRRQGDLFLHRIAATEIQERLTEVNRRFTAAAVVTAFPVPWQAALPDARVLPPDDRLALDPGTHDLIVHAMSLHWADDPVGQMIQCARALRPDGLFIAIAPGGHSLHELRGALAAAESHLTGGLSPRVLPMGEIRDLGALLSRAGFALPVADSVPVAASHATLASLARDLRDMGEQNALTGRSRRPASRALFALAEALLRDHHPAPGDRFATTFDLICLTGWAPHDSQPKPLRPGSAVMRLADALGAEPPN